MDDLFEKNCDFNALVYRNIVSLKISENLFDDLISPEDAVLETKIAIDAEARVKADVPLGLINRGFHYTMAIAYPFTVEPFLSTRFGDGTYGVWYGSLEEKTTLFETAYHMLKSELMIEGLDEIIYRERLVYKVKAQAILIDLRGKQKHYPQLIANEYDFTHAIGARMNRERHPGLLTPSARTKGTNIVAFNPDILSNPTHHHYLTYALDPFKKFVNITNSRGEAVTHIFAKDCGYC